MEKLVVVNGSPRAFKSNSRRLISLFRDFWRGEWLMEYNVVQNKPQQVFSKLRECTDLLFVFPLYVDSLPVTLLHFLKQLEKFSLEQKPTVHLIINCGFLEPWQNDVAVDMLRLFSAQNGFPFGSFLEIGGGEAILDTPFASLVRGKIKKLARAMKEGKSLQLQVTMPLPKWLYLKASEKYWMQYGAKNGITPQQMDTMQIEGR